MRVLVVAHNLPLPSWGAGIRNYHLLKALAGVHEVTLLALVDDAETANAEVGALRPICSDIRIVALPFSGNKRLHQLSTLASGRSHLLAAYSPAQLQPVFDAIVRDTGCRLVVFESALVAGFRTPAGVTRIIDQHNMEHEVLRRTYQATPVGPRKWYNGLEYRRLRKSELDLCRKADGLVATSERERHLFEGAAPSVPVCVVPNGVDTAAFQTSARPQVPGRVVFTGTMGYFPNVQAALYFAKECWPRIRAEAPEATWYVVGSYPPPEIERLGRLPGVTVTGKVAEVQPYLEEAEVAIAPLLIGGGTRLKILEALAMRKAVVSTSLGCEGIEVVPGEHLIVANEAEQMARDVVALLRDPARRRALGEAGRALVERLYSWERCGEEMLRFVGSVRGVAGARV